MEGVAGQPTGVAAKASESRGPAFQGHQHEEKILLVLTLIIGAVVGLVVVAFIVLTENLGARLYPAGGAAWRRVLIPIFGALSTGFLLFRYFPNARGSGIPQTKAALFLRDGYITFRTVLGKFGLCSISLASGIALGREGPSVHVGAGIASSLARRLGLSTASVKALVPCGASAAIAAAFNTPISAVLFALEEVMGDMHAPVLGSVVLSSATSWIVLHLILGDEPLFHVPAYQLVHPVEFIFYAVLGLAGGFMSTSFVKLLLWQRKHFLAAPRNMQWFLPGIGGLTVGILGWFFPEVLGVGYGFVSKALNGQMPVGTMALLVVLKIIATSTCYASGNAGGIFGPSLFLGAMMGGAVGGMAHTLFPDYTGSVGAYALAGMGAAFAGIVRAPLTSVIMVFEITRDYSIIVPLMIANLISYFIASHLQDEPIYEALQHQDGIRLPSGTRARQDLLTVGHAYETETPVLAASERIGQARASVDRERGVWPVIDDAGFRGMVTLAELDEAVQNSGGEAPLAQLVPSLESTDVLLDSSLPHVYPDDPLDAAMRWLASGRIRAIPVLSRLNTRELKGTISLRDVLAAYDIGTTEKQQTTPPRSTRFPTGLLAGLSAIVISILIVAGLLNYFYRAERSRRAEQYFAAGNEFLQKDRFPEAIEQFRNALSISHRVRDRLALGLALLKADRMTEALIYLEEVVREQPDNGPANAGIAEVDARSGKVDDAVLHFQRAIVGTWPNDPEQNRFKAHIELVDFLQKRGRLPQARAELLALAADLPPDEASRKQAGRMLLDLGIARAAVDLYTDLLKSGRPDAAEFDGLGDAQFALANYRRADDAFRDALRIDASDQHAARGAEACEKILALDPATAGIGAKERYQRSRVILSNIADELAACATSEVSEHPASQAKLAEARSLLAEKRRPASFSDAADTTISLAIELWKARVAACAAPSGDSPLQRIMAKLTSR
jgi:CIC family chloride channel protein